MSTNLYISSNDTIVLNISRYEFERYLTIGQDPNKLKVELYKMSNSDLIANDLLNDVCLTKTTLDDKSTSFIVFDNITKDDLPKIDKKYISKFDNIVCLHNSSKYKCSNLFKNLLFNQPIFYESITTSNPVSYIGLKVNINQRLLKKNTIHYYKIIPDNMLNVLLKSDD